jgi:hypothetical protein
MLALSVTKPCHENWEEMLPTEQGAYCRSCCKNVIDFSSMTDQEIFDYFQKKTNEPVCGRFGNDQLNRPLVEISPAVFMMRVPFWQKFLAALFLYFSTFIIGCSSHKEKDYTTIEVPGINHIATKQVAAAKVDQGRGSTERVKNHGTYVLGFVNPTPFTPYCPDIRPTVSLKKE